MTLTLQTRVEHWPIAGTFTIARGSRTEAVVVVAEVTDGVHTGRGECVPYKRYGETVDSVLAELAAASLDGDREALRHSMAPGAARNALDCALWDLEAKAGGDPVWQRCGLAPLKPLTTAYTLSLGDPDSMAAAARDNAERPILKLKLGGDGDPERVRAVRSCAPRSRLIADANEAWSEANLEENMRACADAGVTLIEQPLPADADDLLAELEHPVPICADESVHTTEDLDGLTGKYEAVNIKLDKTGGLTEALLLLREAQKREFTILVGCMIGTSLAMAPALLLAQEADLVDLDGPLLLAKDRQPGLVYSGAIIQPPDPDLWG
jgi:L-alanine-DL-glutamate epimerase-like enolase superfamily enzyme